MCKGKCTLRKLPRKNAMSGIRKSYGVPAKRGMKVLIPWPVPEKPRRLILGEVRGARYLKGLGSLDVRVPGWKETLEDVPPDRLIYLTPLGEPRWLPPDLQSNALNTVRLSHT